MAHEVALRGATSVTVARVIARAGVSRRAFYEQFSDIEDCFLAAFDLAVAQAAALARAAYEAEDGWREGVRAGLAAILRYLDREPLLAQLCIVHAPGGGPRVLARRSQVIGRLWEVVDRGRRHRTVSREPPAIVAEGVVGALLAVIHTRLLARGGGGSAGYAGPLPQQPPLIELHGQLTGMILLPYLGASAAGRELDRPPPPPPAVSVLSEPASSARETVDVDLPGGRLTYRTVCVLRAIAECPGASNREIAQRAGIVDQGQISKVLGRLREQGLVINRAAETHSRGTPNAWLLTERGEALERKLREPPSSMEGGDASSSVRPNGRRRSHS